MSLELEMWQWNEICRLMDNQEKREEERWEEFQDWMNTEMAGITPKEQRNN